MNQLKQHIGLILIIKAFGLALVALFGYYYYFIHYVETPDQPINFSHYIHASKLGLACTACHKYGDRSEQMTPPAMSICMGCHVNFMTDRPEIQKLTKYWNDKQPIPWNRVHSFNVQKDVQFTHKRHIKAGIDCTDCHGDVKMMSQMRRVNSLEMGWCVSCHKQNGASTDCLTCHK